MVRKGLVSLALMVIALSDAQSQEMCRENTELGNPGGADVTLCHDGYAVGYSYTHKIPVWCAYWIFRENVDVNVERSDDFRAHPSIPPEFSAQRDDYRGSGYDRGHCAPSGSIDYSASANSETFFYTNMFPQMPGFNRDMFSHSGVWGFLEGESRQWARERDRVYVISGAHVPPGAATIGQGVTIPSHFFKVMINPIGPEVIAFWMPHEPNTKYNASQYLVSVDFIEQQTGLDLLSMLQDDQENEIEGVRAQALW
jgi:endonuclease G